MTGKVDYDLSDRHLVIRIEGSYPTGHLIQALKSGLAILEPGLRAMVLIDARASTGSRPTEEVRESAALLATLAPRIERVAIVVSSEVHFGLARMGSMLAGELAAATEVFRDLAEAQAYLDAAPDG